MRGKGASCTNRNFKPYEASLQKELKVQTVTKKDEVKSSGNKIWQGSEPQGKMGYGNSNRKRPRGLQRTGTSQQKCHCVSETESPVKEKTFP